MTYNWTTINHTAKVKGFITIKDKKTAQKFHEHIQQFIDDNSKKVAVFTQGYKFGDLLHLE